MARPKTRAECPTTRPCPFVSCRYHLAVDITATGELRQRFSVLDMHRRRHTCALDVADEGGATASDIARLLNVSRYAVYHTERIALSKLRRWLVLRLVRGDSAAVDGHEDTWGVEVELPFDADALADTARDWALRTTW